MQTKKGAVGAWGQVSEEGEEVDCPPIVPPFQNQKWGRGGLPPCGPPISKPEMGERWTATLWSPHFKTRNGGTR
jgi:hypothetical protein